ncbi:MAG TPA: hypothetical protein PJ991_05905 [Kiritimatiellia bacterium]|nr:hypothetical protein [Kiritimatiellia bacterium]
MESDPISTSNEFVPVRAEDGRFLPGTIAPGRPKGRVGGRAAALLELDAVMATADNRKVLREALQAHFLADPIRFFRQIIMPLLPTEVKMKLGEEGAVTWLSLSTTPRTQANNPSMMPAIGVSELSVADAAGEKPSV